MLGPNRGTFQTLSCYQHFENHFSLCYLPLHCRINVEGSSVFANIRSRLFARYGVSCLNAFERTIRPMAQKDAITRREVKFGLRDLGVEVTTAELDEMMGAMQTSRSGPLSVADVVSALRGEKHFSSRRRELIEKVFNVLDTSKCGAVTIEDLKENYDASALPKVRAGRQTSAQALATFLREWETNQIDNNSEATVEAGISVRRFTNYYSVCKSCVLLACTSNLFFVRQTEC